MGTDSVGRHLVEDLIGRVALQNRAAFDALYELTSSKLLAIAMQVLKDKADAEEALQDTFVKIWRSASSYAPDGTSPMSWLITIARNASIDVYRRRPQNEADDIDLGDIPDETGVCPEESAVMVSEASQLHECLSKLDSKKAYLIREAYFRGQTYAELAERTETPVNTIKTWVRRSLSVLRTCLNEAT